MTLWGKVCKIILKCLFKKVRGNNVIKKYISCIVRPFTKPYGSRKNSESSVDSGFENGMYNQTRMQIPTKMQVAQRPILSSKYFAVKRYFYTSSYIFSLCLYVVSSNKERFIVTENLAELLRAFYPHLTVKNTFHYVYPAYICCKRASVLPVL